MNPIFGSGKKVSMTMLLPVLAAILSLMLITPSSYASVGSSDTTSTTTNTSPTTAAATATNSSVLPPPQPEGIVNVGVTPNQLAAGGPLPGNHSVALEEVECAAEENNPPWYPTVNPAELADSNRTHVYACASFLGSFTGPNQVYAYASPEHYYSPIFAVTRGTNELYVLAGSWGNLSPKPSGPFVAKLNVGDLTQLWRTDLANLNATTSPTGVWNYIGGLNVLADGSLAVVAGSHLYKLNGTSGAVEAELVLPTGESLPSNTAFNGMAAWPDGTLVLKPQTRAPGCSFDGALPFAIPCPGQSDAPNSVLVVVDSKTWELLDWTEMDGNIASRVAATVYNDTQYAYVGNATNLVRYIWDGQNITLDDSWQPARVTKPGQTNLLANMIADDWVFDFTNCCPPTDTPLSVVAVSQANASKMNRIDPIPLDPGEQSYIPSNSAVDPENDMMYVMDGGAGEIVGLKYDPVTGNMSVAWRGNQSTLAFLSLIGPADQRVLVGSDMAPNTTISQMVNNPPPTYAERVVWRDAATGEVLAASDYFSGMSAGAPLAPGFGGLLYYMTSDGHIMALQVLPQANNATSTTAAAANTTTTTTNAAPTPNSTSTSTSSTTSGAGG